MQLFRKVIFSLTTVVRTVALSTMVAMMFFIFFAVLSRQFYRPVIGDIELVQLGMVVLIMFGLAYTEQIKGHISIGIFVDRFPQKLQRLLDCLGYALTIGVTGLIAYTFVGVAQEHQYQMRLSTDLMSIPFYPFDWVIVIGFCTWGLEALLGLIDSIIGLFE
ncbi:MAG TPA: TRAP transporter small permease [Paenalcaligenes sp.]|nr:TRAP transporter small permease [Paenalcaligenes sp.]